MGQMWVGVMGNIIGVDRGKGTCCPILSYYMNYVVKGKWYDTPCMCKAAAVLFFSYYVNHVVEGKWYAYDTLSMCKTAGQDTSDVVASDDTCRDHA